MPSPYIVRSFAPHHYYHVFNRGIERRKIFQSESDFKMFKYYLFIYLSPLETVLKIYPTLKPRLQAHNLSKELELVAYCLMPNHFHLLIGQKTINGISKFMKQLTVAYTKYFNATHNRIGNLMGSRFKAVSVTSEDLLIHISRYIHLNPLVANLVVDLRNYQWSSYITYVGDNNSDDFCNTKIVFSRFKAIKDYENFVRNQQNYAKELSKIKHLTIEHT